jgi:LysR family transcriptional regulator, low CO2-responsive transcriptional regulator
MLDLNKLLIFAQVAQAGSFSAAAESLYMSQSAVSQHIKELEAALGQNLFERGRRGVSLTPQGELLRDYAEKILTLAAQAEAALTKVEALKAGKLSFGATPGVGVYLAPDWVQAFRGTYPQMSLILQTGLSQEMAEGVLRGRLELALVEGEPGPAAAGLGSLILEEVEQRAVVGFRHPFWGREGLRLEELRGQALIVRQAGSQSRQWLESQLGAAGIGLTIGAEFDQLEAIKRAVQLGTCLAILPPYVTAREVEQGLLHSIPIEGRPLRRPLRLLWRAGRPLGPIARAFLASLAPVYPILARWDSSHFTP